MTLGSVHAGDIVLADVKGRRFYALVEEKARGQLTVRPLDARISWRSLTSRQVVEHWHKSRRQTRRRSSEEVMADG